MSDRGALVFCCCISFYKLFSMDRARFGVYYLGVLMPCSDRKQNHENYNFGASGGHLRPKANFSFFISGSLWQDRHCSFNSCQRSPSGCGRLLLALDKI
jgi:hypothetical protein